MKEASTDIDDRMTETETLHPLLDLPTRYKISRTVVYERINGLGIKLIKSGRRSFVSQPDLDKLDELHQHIDQGGTIAEFREASTDIGLQIEPIVKDALIYKAFEVLSGVNRHRFTDPVWQHERLEKCSENGWLLTSGEVKQLIGVKPHGKVFLRGIWQFERVGKIGRSASWQIKRTVEPRP